MIRDQYRIYGELSLLNNNLLQKQAKYLHKQTFFQRLTTANKHMKGHSTLLLIREMQIKATMRYHFTPIRMATIKKEEEENNKRGKDTEKLEP